VCARASRPDRLAGLLGPAARFAWGTLLLLLFLPQRALAPKAAMALAYGLLAMIAGKRINWLYFGFLTLSIAAFNLLSPWGRVLATLGPLRVTEGALVAGLSKGITVTGLVFISLFTVSRDLRLPGRFGMFLGRSFYYFERLSVERRRIRRVHVWEDIDAILESASAEDESPEAAPAAGGSAAWRVSPAGAVLAAATVGAAAATFFF
jgi:heptaprenyl diphosphate synthase